MYLKKEILFSIFLLITSVSFAQKITVSGKVSDSSGGLPGVSVFVKGTQKGTTTDFNGDYSISAFKGATLVYSYLGYATKEIKIYKKIYNVFLEESSNVLDEVVVTAFGIKKKEKSLGYSVQKVDAEDINSSGTSNALERLQGQVAGVSINRTSGSAGGGVDILIRGISSVDPTRNNQPLIIVDGVALNNDTFTGNVLPSEGSNATGSSEQFNFSSRSMDINPDDIESYNVLKGAAASALYGIKASNGAIIITTKKGKLGKAKVSLSTSLTLKEVRKMPQLQSKYREGHRTSMRPGAIIDPNEPDGYDDHGFAFYTWGPEYTEDSWDYGKGVIGDLSNDKFYNTYKDFFRTGITRQANLSVSGASEKLDYYFSVGNSMDEGIVPNTNYSKTNVRVKGGYKIKDNFTIGTSVSYTKSGGKRSNGGDKSIFSSLSFWSPTFPINDYKYEDGSQKNYSRGIIDNPRYFAETSNLEDDVNRWTGNFTANWKPLQWLNISWKAQIDNYSDQRNRFVPADLDVGTKVGGFVVNENINFTGLESTLLATINHEINSNFNTSLTLGHQVRDNKTNYDRVRGEGLNVPRINKLSNTVNPFPYNNISKERTMGVFGDLKLAYQEKLFLTLTGRNDWLSAMPKSNRSFFYSSASLSYLFTEDFFKDSDVFSFGKLRASWAEVGKGPKINQIGSYFIPDPSFPFNGSGGYIADTSIGYINLKPERTTSIEIGADLRFVNNRFRLDYSYYHNTVNDQIFPVGTSYSSGIKSLVRNAGQYKSWGHELLISADIIKKENLKWTSSINFSTTGGKVTQIPDDLDEIVFFADRVTSKAKEGDALGTLYGWVFQTAPSGERYVGSDGKWIVTGSKNEGFYYQNKNEMVKVGNAFPDYIASLRNDLQWKNIGLSFLLEYKKGGDVYDRGYRNAIRNGNLKDTEFRNEKKVLQGVMDDGNGGYVPNTTELLITANSFYRDFNNYNMASEILVKDASWLKLRTISLSYSLPKSILKKLKVDTITATFGAHNILLWTPFKGFDPESNQFSAGSNIYGFTGLNVPLTQDYTLGLKFEF